MGNVYKGNVHKGNVYQGNVYQGNVYKGNVYKGNVYKGDVQKGNVYKGSVQGKCANLYTGTAKAECYDNAISTSCVLLVRHYHFITHLLFTCNVLTKLTNTMYNVHACKVVYLEWRINVHQSKVVARQPIGCAQTTHIYTQLNYILSKRE